MLRNYTRLHKITQELHKNIDVLVDVLVDVLSQEKARN
uniref:Uncharacterized protein n=1 Tax=Myoviridae sp. ctegP15 TaxID=2825146 RepID=A0A8S5P4I6_9CAUD|nr:MAG TPA: hypothetical protein [Myoviridae sp. ctegP15]